MNWGTVKVKLPPEVDIFETLEGNEHEDEEGVNPTALIAQLRLVMAVVVFVLFIVNVPVTLDP